MFYYAFACIATQVNADPIWYWGDKPDSDYVLKLPSNTHDIVLPFTPVWCILQPGRRFRMPGEAS
jgi:hypothetical protein